MATADFAITKFKASLKHGGARPSLFKVIFDYPSGIPDPPTKASFLVKATTIPASTIGSYDVFYHGKAIKVAGDRTFDTWDTTIFNDEDFGIRNTLENWMAAISNHKLNTRNKGMFDNREGDVAQYKSTLKVQQFSKAGKVLRTYTFVGALITLFVNKFLSTCQLSYTHVQVNSSISDAVDQSRLIVDNADGHAP